MTATAKTAAAAAASVPAAVAASAPAVTAAPAVDLTPRRGAVAFDRTLPLTLNVTANPKRGASAMRFALYAGCKTAGDYIDAVVKAGDTPGLAVADLKWDTHPKRNFIKLG